MAGDNNLDLALRMKAENSQAKSALREVKKEIEDVEQAATKANTSQVQTAKAVVDAHEKAAAATKKEADALKESEQAAGKASAGAEKLGNSLGKVTGRLATGNVTGATREIQRFGENAARSAIGAGVLGVSVLGAVAAVTALTVAYVQGRDETAAFNNALILTGGYAGKSSADLQALAIRLDSLSGVTEHAAAAVITQVTRTGRFYGEQLQMVATAALQMQQATGQSIDATIKQFEALGERPVQSALALDRTMHFLTQSVYDHMTALVQQGQEEQAAEVGQQALADAIAKRTAAVNENVGILQATWRGLKNAAKEAWDAMLNVGRSDDGVNLRIWQQQLEAARKNLAAPGLDDATIRVFMAQANEAQAMINKLSGETAKDAKQVSDALAAQQSLAQAGITPLRTYLDTVAKYTQQYKTAIVGADDATKAAALENLQNALAKAQKIYEAATREPKAPKALIDHSAEKAARDAARAQEELYNALIKVQTAADPTAAAYARYNEQVKHATEWAEAAKKATGANTEAIDAQRDAVIAGAQAELEAAKIKIEAKRLADQDRAVKGLLDKAPKGYDVPVEIGGAQGEMLKLQQSMAALNAWHTKATQANQAFRRQDVRNERQYQQNLADIEKYYRDQKAVADQAAHQLSLTAAEQGFGALANAMANFYGQQSAQYRAAFALQKAAALIHTIMNIKEAASGALAHSGNPWLGFANMALIISQGAELIAAIRGAKFSSGGYTGPGGKYEPAGIVHAGEVVWSQDDVARAGGVGIVDAMRLRGYADGGVVSPFAGAPSPSALGFSAPSTPAVNTGRLVVVVSPVTVILHSSGNGDDVQSKQSTDNNGGQVLELFLGAVAKDISNGGVTAKAADRRWLLKRKGNSYG